MGADGLIFIHDDPELDFSWRFFNSDGSEAEMCGNGLRVFGRYVFEATGKDKIDVETLMADYSIDRIKDFFEDIYAVCITLSNVVYYEDYMFEDFKGKTEPYDYQFFTVSNPHTVAVVDKEILASDKVVKIGTYANEDKATFEQGVNMNFLSELGDNKIYVRTFERGVGLTKSCGTGMISSTTRYCLKNDAFDQWIEVYNDGGMIKCRIKRLDKNHFEADFMGNATYMFAGKLDLDTLETSELSYFDNEEKVYQRLLECSKGTLA